MTVEHVDVLVVGAGISGIGAGYHLQTRCPGRSYLILEGRERIGGTWDLFRYPGIRSDSDMYTLGYSFKPWTAAKSIADGPSILAYLNETAAEHGIDRRIRFGHRVTQAAWSGDEACWTVTVERAEDGASLHFRCNFLFLCTGYYDYAHGYSPVFPGADRFRGRVVHPQHWTPDIDYAGKRVVVIGSGATAVTLVPELAKQAAHVTMLQRSPTYVVSRPDEDALANGLRRWLPERFAYRVTRWKNVLLGLAFFQFCRRRPARARAMLLDAVSRELGPDFDVERHFTPRYDPWDQRLCLVPNGDLFQALRDGRAAVATDRIETFTETGIRLQSGTELEADLIVTATGLELQLWSGIAVQVNGVAIDPARCLTYKGMMCSDVPNLALSIGYTNASWTLKCDLTCEYVCRLLNHMARHGYSQCCPRHRGAPEAEEPLMDFSSGYVQRAIDRFPKQGTRTPWKLHQNYALDLLTLGFGRLEDGAMEFSTAAPREVAAPLAG